MQVKLTCEGKGIGPAAGRVEMLATLLMQQGACDVETIGRARRVAIESGQRLDRVLVQLGFVSERTLAEAFVALLGFKLTTPDRYPVEPLFQGALRPQFLRHAQALPVALENNTLAVAVTDPLDSFIPTAVGTATGLRIALEVAVPAELDAAFERLYPVLSTAGQKLSEAISETAPEPLEEDAERLKDLASEAPVIRLVNQILGRAVETQASDIHIEPFDNGLRLRYRYDGMLHEAEAPPARLTAAITSRIKIMARLDIAERRLPQDGRIKLAVRGQDVDFRVATAPSLWGESVVIRVLDRNAVTFDYAKLGLPPCVVERFSSALELPNGIVLVTGPTGSGKTTTLYTGLLALNSAARKIITIEDPIEYHFRGVTQIQIQPQIGLTFASLLRSLVRHNPDVMMVGEIRDAETAQIAMQAALTGQLVLSTVHTNSAAATVARLRDMGVEDYLLTAVLRGIMAQRLVRRLCMQCRRRAAAPPELVRRFHLEQRHGANGPIVLWHPVGCVQCRNTGFRGRLPIAEFLVADAELERLIFAHADHTEIERAAVAAGMKTMFDAGIDAALAGITTIEEVVHMIRAEG